MSESLNSWLLFIALFVVGSFLVSLYRAHLHSGIDWERVATYVALFAITFVLMGFAALAPEEIRHVAWSAFFLFVGVGLIVLRDDLAPRQSTPAFASRRPAEGPGAASIGPVIVGGLFLLIGVLPLVGS